MKKRKHDVYILLLYCVPYVFLGMLGDYAANTLLLYILMVAALLALLLYCMKTERKVIAMIGNLLVRMAEQLLSPSFALKLERLGNMLEAGLALDEQGVPDVFFGMRVGADQMRFDADAAGLRYRENEHTIAITPELLLRVLTTDETGASLLPDVREEDVQLLMQAA